MKELRTRVRGVILAITGVLVVLVLIRLILLLTGASTTQAVVGFFVSITDPFVLPFREFNAFLNIGTLEAASITALMVIIVMGLLVSDIVTAFLYDDISDIILNVVDAIFKFLEAALVIRLVMKLFGIPVTAGLFVANLYGVTNWASGIFPEFKVGNGAIEVSTVAVLIIVAVIDFATEGLVLSLRNNMKRKDIAEKQSAPLPAPAPATKTVVNTPAPMQQHITINVPVPQQQAPVQPHIDRQVINVQAPPPSIPQNPNA